MKYLKKNLNKMGKDLDINSKIQNYIQNLSQRTSSNSK